MATKPNPDDGPPRKRELPVLVNVWAVAGEIGIKLVVPLLIFMLPGIWLDKQTNTSPLFMVLGMLLAFATSVLLIWRIIQRVEEFQKGSKK